MRIYKHVEYELLVMFQNFKKLQNFLVIITKYSYNINNIVMICHYNAIEK